MRHTTFACAIILFSIALPGEAAESTCVGTPGKGRLEGGVQLKKEGPNFAPYSTLGTAIGRTYVHAKVAKVTAEAYGKLARSSPDKFFVYGESGWAKGGRIRPHRTHQNGLSIDFMVPVLNAEGKSVPLPGSAKNKFGYGIEFDRAGQYERFAIDFDAVAEHLYALHTAAQANGVGLARVIFEPDYIAKLHATKRGEFIRKHIVFMQKPAWIRHDEHYHVDFALPCRRDP